MGNAQQELEAFHQFATGILESAETDITFDELVDCWKSAALRPEDVEAVREALQDLEAGEVGQDFGEFMREFRERHGIPVTT